MRRVLFALLGLPALLRACHRARASVRLPLDLRVDRLRGVPPFRVRALADPQSWSAIVGRLGVLLPLDGGRCWRRSLLLLDLHSRCGLAPRLELVFRASAEGGPEGHAWLTTDEGPRRAALSSGPEWRRFATL